MKVVDLRDIY